MFQRAARLLAALLVLNVSACGLLNIALYPLKLLFDVLGAGASAVGIAAAVPTEGPAPVVTNEGGGRFVVSDLRPGAPCTIVCSADGCESRTYEWPGDFAGRDGHVVVSLQRSR